MEQLKTILKLQNNKTKDKTIFDGFITKDYKNYVTIGNGKIRIPAETLPTNKADVYSSNYGQEDSMDLMINNLKEVKLNEDFSPKKFELNSKMLIDNLDLNLDLEEVVVEEVVVEEVVKEEVVVEEEEVEEVVIEDSMDSDIVEEVAETLSDIQTPTPDLVIPIVGKSAIPTETKPKGITNSTKRIPVGKIPKGESKESIIGKMKNLLGIGVPKIPKEPRTSIRPKSPINKNKPSLTGKGKGKAKEAKPVDKNKNNKTSLLGKKPQPTKNGKASNVGGKMKPNKEVEGKQKSINEMLLNSETYRKGDLIINKNEKVGDE